MQKLTWSEFEAKMRQAINKENKSISGVIVFKPESFDKYYDVEGRSYRTWSDNKFFKDGMGGNSIFASCLDGTDQCIRLDWYLFRSGDKNWKIDYCYIEE